MQSEIVFSVCDAQIGYQTRKVTPGPEHDLVADFIQNGLNGQGYSFRTGRLAVFVEPRIASGFPDLVLAEFKPGFYERWTDARNLLTSRELKMLSFLYSVNGADSKTIRKLMNETAANSQDSLELLFDAELIDRDRSSRCWRPLPLDKTYGIKRLIAIEAKVCNNAEVLEQASLNRWFASESYALTPTSPDSAFAARARRAGVGVVVATGERSYRQRLKPRQFGLPSSHASWQFNEWIGRRLSCGEACNHG